MFTAPRRLEYVKKPAILSSSLLDTGSLSPESFAREYRFASERSSRSLNSADVRMDAPSTSFLMFSTI